MSTSIPTTGAQAPIVRQPREIRAVEDSGPLANLFDTARFEHMFRISAAMAAASLIPEHLRGIRKQGTFTPFAPEEIKANCFLVVNQSVRWGMDPFAVAPETYVVGGKLAYQGKLIAAVINARAGLSGRLKYAFSGTKGKDDFTITVSGKFLGDNEPSEVQLSVGEGKTENQMWRKDPEQKLVYSGVVKWARRYCPEIVLGIVTDDDLDRMTESAAAGAKQAQARELPTRPKFQPPAPKPGDDDIPGLGKNADETAETSQAADVTLPAAESVEPLGEDEAAAGPDPAEQFREWIFAALTDSKISEIDLLKYLRSEYRISSASVRELPEEGARQVCAEWAKIAAALKEVAPAKASTSLAKETIATALREMSIPQGPFMQGLAKILPEASKNWTKVEQMTDEVANMVLNDGLDGILALIRGRGVKL